VSDSVYIGILTSSGLRGDSKRRVSEVEFYRESGPVLVMH
jgi:hypothetical protein